MPHIKLEPGTEESPFASAFTRHSAEQNSSKRKERDDSPLERDDSPSRFGPHKKQNKQKAIRNDEEFEDLLRKIQATETWQYLAGLTSHELTVPNVSEQLLSLLEQTRKRDLPLAWRNRLAVEKPSFSVKKLLIYYLTSDRLPNSYLCSLPCANCREKFMTMGPAKDSSKSFSGKRKCCSAVYRNSLSDMMPPIWSPPASAAAPVLSLMI